MIVPAMAQAQPEVRVVGRIAGATRFTDGPIEARIGQVVELAVKLAERRDRFSDLPAGAQVRWLRVTPRMQHRDHPSRIDGLHIYANSQMFGSNHGRWIGLDTLEYDTEALEPEPGIEIDGAALRLEGVPQHRYGTVGSAWFAAEVTFPDGEVVRTPDGSTVDPMGLTSDVMRLAFRADDTFLGWLGTYFGVPYIFGSTGAQTDRYTGTDCADALVGARRASGARRARYTSVTGLAHLARPTTPLLFQDAEGRIHDAEGDAVELRWGEDLRSGDMLLMDFVDDPTNELPRAWDHASVLIRDGEPSDGVLDGADPVRHMTMRGLADQPLSRMGHIRFRLYRWR